MRVAVFSDLHGNPYACRAVLSALRAEEACDAAVIAGDICLGGSDPAACIDLLCSEGVQAVIGNTETYLAAPESPPNDELHRSIWFRVQPVAHWVLERLSAAQLSWLGALPFELRFTPTSDPANDLLVVHANPRDVELMILPPYKGQEKYFGEVRQPDDDPALSAALQACRAGTIAFGHIHLVFQRQLHQRNLVSVAPCSLPGFDHDWRARYTVFTWRDRRWQIDRRWIDYGAQQEIDALLASDLPYKEDYVCYFTG